MKQIFNTELHSPVHGHFRRGDEVPDTADRAWIDELAKAGYVVEVANKAAAAVQAEESAKTDEADLPVNRMADVQAAQAMTAAPVGGAKSRAKK